MRTDHNLKAICDNLRQHHGDFHKSCRLAGLSTDFVMNWIKDDRVAAASIDEAQKIGWMGLESVLVDRAVHGTQKQVWHKGEVVGYETQYSDTLLIKAVEARVPAYKKGEQATNTFNGPTQINLMPRAETFDQWLEMKARTLSDRATKALPAPVPVPDIIQGEYVEVSRPLAALEGLL